MENPSNKTQLYRFCIKSGNFEGNPTFRVKIGKSEKKINPSFVSSDKQRYNCDCILERRNQEEQLIISCFIGYKFMGSGTLSFESGEMYNKQIEVFNKDKQSIGVIDCSCVKIDKVTQIPALSISVKTGAYANIKEQQGPYLVLKYGELKFQTKNSIQSNGGYTWNEKFSVPPSQMDRILVQSWAHTETGQKFLGISIVYLRSKQDMNSQRQFEIFFMMGKQLGKIQLGIFEDKNSESNSKDYSQAVKRTIKTTVVEAVMVNPIKKGTYIALEVGGQQFITTSLFVQEKIPKWNQSFMMQVNSERQELSAKLCLKDGSVLQLGRSFLEISKVSNRTYEVALLDEKELEIGKIYFDFYDQALDIKEVPKKKGISQALRRKITSKLTDLEHRYKKQEYLHDYMKDLNEAVQKGLVHAAYSNSNNPLRELGNFLMSYKKH